MNWFKRWKSKIIPSSLNENIKTESKEEEMNSQELYAIERNLYWRDKIQWSGKVVLKSLSELSEILVDSVLFVQAVKNFQRKVGLKADGILGPKTYDSMVQHYQNTPYELAVRTIMEPTIGKESGGRYWAQNRDGEFKGLFKGHRAEGKIHIGLSFGILQFTQDGGSLGMLLSAMAKQSPSRFEEIMGPTYDKLLEVTNLPGSSGFITGAKRGPRVKPVPVYDQNMKKVERDLWEEPWTSKFDKLGRDPDFQRIQRKIAEESYLRPILKFLKENGWVSEKMVAVAFSGAIHRGVSGMKKFIERASEKHYLPTEEQVLEEIKARDPKRFASIIDAENLSMDRWVGLSLLEQEGVL